MVRLLVEWSYYRSGLFKKVIGWLITSHRDMRVI